MGHRGKDEVTTHLGGVARYDEFIVAAKLAARISGVCAT